jgi:hypothetical protein
MKKIIFLSAALTFCIISFAQSNENQSTISNFPGQTSFYAELGGPGILFSANIDRRFNKSHLGWGGRVGVGFVSGYNITSDSAYYSYYYDKPASVVTFPVQVNYVFGKPNSPHTFEVGGGITIAGRKLNVFDFYDSRRSSFFGTFSFMYRRQPVNGGFSWRIGFTPIIAQGYIQPSGGVSVGYNF